MNTTAPLHPASFHPLHLEASPRLALGLVGLGSAGVVATSLCYLLAGDAAALPLPGLTLAAAMQAVHEGAPWMRAAGLIGMPSDVVLIIGCGLMGLNLARQGRSAQASGWATVALATLLFVMVDTLAAVLLPSLAADPAQLALFGAFRRLYDGFFVLGTFSFGLGLLGLALPRPQAGDIGGNKARVMMGTLALLSLLSAAAYPLGLPLARATGLAIALGALLFAVLATRAALREGQAR